MSRPLILLDPHPRTAEMVYTDDCAARLDALGEVVAHFGDRMPDAQVDALLPRVALIIGQTAMGRERLDRALALRGILNVKGNWEPTVDYAHAQALGIPVLSAAPCMAPAVAEFCLGQAIALLRGLPRADAAFRAGREAYGIAGNRAARSLYGARVGLLGVGNLGRALIPLLQPFGMIILAHDPWQFDGALTAHGVQPRSLEALLAEAQVLFVLAGVTMENAGFLDAAALARIPHDTAVILASRAEVVAFDALLAEAASGRLRVAIDVFPEEPVPPGHPLRTTPNVLFTAHLAGGIAASYARIREAMLDDAAQLLAGKPPGRLQAAHPRLAAMSISR